MYDLVTTGAGADLQLAAPLTAAITGRLLLLGCNDKAGGIIELHHCQCRK